MIHRVPQLKLLQAVWQLPNSKRGPGKAFKVTVVQIGVSKDRDDSDKHLLH